MEQRQGTVLALTATGLGLGLAATRHHHHHQQRKAATADGVAVAGRLPPRMIDPHFHFLDPVSHPEQHATLLRAHPDLQPYLPEDYRRDFTQLAVEKSVHMEVIPDDFVREVVWVQQLVTGGRHGGGAGEALAQQEVPRAPWVHGIVAAADPTQPDFEQILRRCREASPLLLKGIRWILNWDGELQPGETPTVERATWPRTVRSAVIANPSAHTHRFPPPSSRQDVLAEAAWGAGSLLTDSVRWR
jgi:hypothetical protein